MKKNTENNLVVYVIAGQIFDRINDRVRKIITLKPSFFDMHLFTPGNKTIFNQNIQLKPPINPTGILRILKLNKLKNLLDKYIFFPSKFILYARLLEKTLSKYISKDLTNGKSICLITCVPPHDLCLISLNLKRKYPDIRWLIDWQDLWSYDESYFSRIPKIYQNKLLKLEDDCLKECDLNITTNKYATDVLVDKYNIPKKRIINIPHHFSIDDLSGAQREHAQDNSDNSIIRIGFMGQLFKPPKVPGLKLLNIIEQLRGSNLNVELHIHGAIPDKILSTLGTPQCEGVISHGTTDHNSCMKLMMQYDFLLLLLEDIPNCRAIMNIKLPHYMITGVPILAIVPVPSSLSDVIQTTGTGYVIPAQNDWFGNIRDILQDFLNNSPLPTRNEVEVNKYAWSHVSKLWLDAINGDGD